MKKILIAGGAGFVGSNLSQTLIERGDEVICLDNLSTGLKRNVEDLAKSPNFSFIEHDVQKPLHLDVDEIYNLACPASPSKYQIDPDATFYTSILGNKNLMDLAKKVEAKYLFASTSEIYGDPLEHPQKETYWGNVNIRGPRSCYDEGKRAAETMIYNQVTMHDLDFKTVRIFNTYGPNMDANDGRVVSNFLNQAIKGEDITVYGDGQQTRSFCYVSDLVKGLIKVMDSNFDNRLAINLGNPNEFTILRLAEKVVDITDSKSKVVMKQLPQDDPVRRKPDISLAKEILDWEPTVTLETGLLQTAKYFQNKFNA